MILSDLSIRANLARKHQPLRIDPLDVEAIQPASVDVRLGDSYCTITTPMTNSEIRPGVPASFITSWNQINQVFTLPPGAFCLASTLEHVTIPDDLVARVEGKSTLARVGIAVHVTAGYIDPGFTGTITLELVNHSQNHVTLSAGMKIAQLSFHRLTTPALRPYGTPGLGSRYQGQTNPTPARELGDSANPSMLAPGFTDASVRDMGLSPRVLRSLLRNDIESLRQLMLMSPVEVLHLRSVGPSALREIENQLGLLGHRLRRD